MPIPRDDRRRTPVVPPAADKDMEKDETTLQKMQRQFEESMKVEQEETAMWARGEVPGMNTKVWEGRYLLKDPEWRFDNIPQLIDGKNIADFVDADIEQMLDELEREEDERMAKLEEENANASQESELDDEEVRIITAIRKKRSLMKKKAQMQSGGNTLNIIRKRDQTFDDLKTHLKSRGFDQGQADDTVGSIRDLAGSRSRSASRMGRKRDRDDRKEEENEGMTEIERKKARREEKSRSRVLSLTPKPGSGMKDLQEALVAKRKLEAARKPRNLLGKKGEGDRVIPTQRPRHLFSGKRGIGKTQRR